MKQRYKTTCSYCGVGCGIIVHKDKYGNLEIEGDVDHPVNKGMLCSKGLHLNYTVMDQSDRLLYPEMRWNKKKPLEKVSWDTALERASAVFKSVIKKFGPDSVGFYVSGQLLTEEYYIVNKLVKGFIGTNNIDTNSRLCMSSAVVGYKKAFGEDSVPVNYSDIEQSDCMMITGANPAWCHPIVFQRIEKHKTENPDTKIIVIDPRKTQTASIADIHLQIKPGTDIILYNAIARYLIENNYIDKGFIENHTDGFEELKSLVMSTSLEDAARICDIDVYDLIQVAKYIGEAKAFLTFWAMGLNQSSIGVNKNLALLNLSIITGQIGKPGSGPFSLTGQPNAMGGREVGGLSNLLPSHRELTNEDHRKEVADFWKVNDIPSKPGYTATEMFEALERDELKAIWIICTNPMVSLPDARFMEKALKKARFVVVQDISKNSITLEHADLVLPAAGWLEKQGTMTNSERRISYLPKIVDPPGEALPDIEILKQFAEKMGYGDSFNYSRESEVFEEHCQLTKNTNLNISGLNYQRLKKEGTKQWPVPEMNHAGTERLFSDYKFYTPNQKAKIHSCKPEDINQKINKDYPLILTTGRIRDQWHTMTRSGKVTRLNQHIPTPFLEIHPKDAEKRNIEYFDIVDVISPRGTVRVKAQITDFVKEGMIFLPMHWGKIQNDDLVRANNVTQNLVDPMSKEPDFKYTAVQVKKFSKTKEKILVVGAGTAALNFIRNYRYLNREDEIHVFSRENIPFYNRIMLPEYLSGKSTMSSLNTITDDELKDLNITVYKGVSINQITKEKKSITTDFGEKYYYDKLVLSTGSQAVIPDNVPKQMSGIFSIRDQDDVDRLKAYVKKDNHFIIIGGGLLGIEMASSLRELDAKVTIILRSSYLMSKQLDPTAGELLQEEMVNRGVEIIYNDSVLSYSGETTIKSIRLTSGRYLKCCALIFAIGTRPNIDIVKDCGIETAQGLIVNSNLQTSDPNVYAIGEIAEFNHKLYGIASAAENQAEVLAQCIAGESTVHYKGSVQMNVLKVPGLDLCAIGKTVYDKNDLKFEEVVILDRRKNYYKKCVIHNDRLVGCILMGDKKEFIDYLDLIENKLELRDKRDSLLRISKASAPVIGKLVCSCNNIGEGNISMHIGEDEITTNDLCKLSGAGMVCGSCKTEVERILTTKKNQQSQRIVENIKS